MAHARIAGEGPELERLQVLVESLAISDRVEFLGRLSEERLVAEYARCSAVWYGARAEDYGLVTLEAFSSAKPVVACTDSGGPADGAAAATAADRRQPAWRDRRR